MSDGPSPRFRVAYISPSRRFRPLFVFRLENVMIMATEDDKGVIAMPLRQGSVLIRCALFMLIYAIAIALYVWYTSPNQVPDLYKGTAADPSTFFTSSELSQSETINAVRNWIYFIGAPWEWV